MLKPREVESAAREVQSFNRVVEFFLSYFEYDIREVPLDFFPQCVASDQDLMLALRS